MVLTNNMFDILEALHKDYKPRMKDLYYIKVKYKYVLVTENNNIHLKDSALSQVIPINTSIFLCTGGC